MNKLKNKLSMLERNMLVSLNVNELSFKVDLSQASEEEQKQIFEDVFYIQWKRGDSTLYSQPFQIDRSLGQKFSDDVLSFNVECFAQFQKEVLIKFNKNNQVQPKTCSFKILAVKNTGQVEQFINNQNEQDISVSISVNPNKAKKNKFKILEKDLTLFVTNEYEIDVSQYVEEEPKEHEFIVDFDQYQLKKKDKVSSIFSNVKLNSTILVQQSDEGKKTFTNLKNSFVSKINKTSVVADSKNFLKSDAVIDMAGGLASDATKNIIGGIAGDEIGNMAGNFVGDQTKNALNNINEEKQEDNEENIDKNEDETNEQTQNESKGFGGFSKKGLGNFAKSKIGKLLKDKAGDVAGDLAGKLVTEIGGEDAEEFVKDLAKDLVNDQLKGDKENEDDQKDDQNEDKNENQQNSDKKKESGGLKKGLGKFAKSKIGGFLKDKAGDVAGDVAGDLAGKLGNEIGGDVAGEYAKGFAKNLVDDQLNDNENNNSDQEQKNENQSQEVKKDNKFGFSKKGLGKFAKQGLGNLAKDVSGDLASQIVEDFADKAVGELAEQAINNIDLNLQADQNLNNISNKGINMISNQFDLNKNSIIKKGQNLLKNVSEQIHKQEDQSNNYLNAINEQLKIQENLNLDIQNDIRQSQFDGNNEEIDGEQSEEYQNDENDVHVEEFQLNFNIIQVGYSFSPSDRQLYTKSQDKFNIPIHFSLQVMPQEFLPNQIEKIDNKKEKDKPKDIMTSNNIYLNYGSKIQTIQENQQSLKKSIPLHSFTQQVKFSVGSENQENKDYYQQMNHGVLRSRFAEIQINISQHQAQKQDQVEEFPFTANYINLTRYLRSNFNDSNIENKKQNDDIDLFDNDDNILSKKKDQQEKKHVNFEIGEVERRHKREFIRLYFRKKHKYQFSSNVQEELKFLNFVYIDVDLFYTKIDRLQQGPDEIIKQKLTVLQKFKNNINKKIEHNKIFKQVTYDEPSLRNLQISQQTFIIKNDPQLQKKIVRKVISKLGKKNVKNIEQVLKIAGIELTQREIENHELDEYKLSEDYKNMQKVLKDRDHIISILMTQSANLNLVKEELVYKLIKKKLEVGQIQNVQEIQNKQYIQIYEEKEEQRLEEEEMNEEDEQQRVNFKDLDWEFNKYAFSITN